MKVVSIGSKSLGCLNMLIAIHPLIDGKKIIKVTRISFIYPR